jgi:DNA-directed RNA polymerase specialized sigma24 family protein
MSSRAVQATVVQRSGDRTFEGFFKERYEPLLRALFLITGDRHEAEDLAQEAFVRVFRRWERLRNTENPGGYTPTTVTKDLRSSFPSR